MNQSGASPLLMSLRRSLEQQIANILFDEVEKGSLQLGETEQIAKDILVELDVVQEPLDFIKALEKISGKYKFLEPLYIRYKSTQDKSKEQEIMQKLSSYIKTQ